VRLILEPTNTVYCRTLDLHDKDTFAEQIMTQPGSAMVSRAVALEDTHLLVIQRRHVEAIINKGKSMTRQRWHVTKQQLEKCRRIFSWDPAVRNVLDLKMAMESTVNCEFFQNLSSFVHMELCAAATFKTVGPGECVFRHLPRPVSYFVIVLRGRLTWSYSDDRQGVKSVDVVDCGYVWGMGSAVNTSDHDVEAIIVLREHWEKCISSGDVSDGVQAAQFSTQHSREGRASFFLTEVEESDFAQTAAAAVHGEWHKSASKAGANWAGLNSGKLSKNNEGSNVLSRFSSGAHSVAESQLSRSQGGHNAEGHLAHFPAKDTHTGEDGSAKWMGVSFGDMSRDEQLAVQKEKHVTCAVTGVRFPAALQHSLHRRQVQVSVCMCVCSFVCSVT